MKRPKGEAKGKAKGGLEPQRLNKALADAGVCSRREADQMIAEGRVSVNGETVRELGIKVDLSGDVVAVDGLRVEVNDPGVRVYLALNKPRGVVSSMKSQFGEPTLKDMIPPRFGRLFPVGRLDRDSQGLVLMTNDGELANRLMHPSQGVERVYHVTLDETLPVTHLKMLRDGHVRLADGTKAQPLMVEPLAKSKTGNPRYVMVLREGKKREIRELIEACRRRVKRLKRVAYGPLELGDATIGRWRMLESAEVKALRDAAGMTEDSPIPGPFDRPEPDWEAAPTRPAKGKSAMGSAKRPADEDREVTFDDFAFAQKKPRAPRAAKSGAEKPGRPSARPASRSASRPASRASSARSSRDTGVEAAKRMGSSKPGALAPGTRPAGVKASKGLPGVSRSATERSNAAKAEAKAAAYRAEREAKSAPKPKPAADGDGAPAKSGPWGTPKSLLEPKAPARPASRPASRPPTARPASKPASGRPAAGRPGSRPTSRTPSRGGAAGSSGRSSGPKRGAGAGGRSSSTSTSRRGANRPRGGKPTSTRGKSAPKRKR